MDGRGTGRAGGENVREQVEEWTDGSRIDGRAAAATRTKAEYLGTMATVVNAEALGVSLGWEQHDIVALDSKGVIQRIQGLAHQQPRSWIEERLAIQMMKRPRTLIWVKGHDGAEGNEMADARAKKEVGRGRRMHKPDIVTPAGIRQAYRLHGGTPAHLRWSRLAIRADIYGGQRSTGTVVERDRQGGGCELCLRWMDTTECGPSVRMSVGRRWERKNEGVDDEG